MNSGGVCLNPSVDPLIIFTREWTKPTYVRSKKRKDGGEKVSQGRASKLPIRSLKTNGDLSCHGEKAEVDSTLPGPQRQERSPKWFSR